MVTLCALLVAMAGGPAQADGLVVHEWGTFTCFVGSGSKAAPIQIDVGADLPSFVLTRPAFAGQTGALELERVIDKVRGCGVLKQQRGQAISRDFAALR